jgi:hypothetical protein
MIIKITIRGENKDDTKYSQHSAQYSMQKYATQTIDHYLLIVII